MVIANDIIGSSKQWCQSPINLEEEKALGIQLPPLVMSGHWNQDGSVRLVNTGSTGTKAQNLLLRNESFKSSSVLSVQLYFLKSM